jgi:hypothetical protein
MHMDPREGLEMSSFILTSNFFVFNGLQWMPQLPHVLVGPRISVVVLMDSL